MPVPKGYKWSAEALDARKRGRDAVMDKTVAALRARIAAGWRPRTDQLLRPEVIAKARAKAAATMAGRPQPPGPTGRGVNNQFAKHWKFVKRERGLILEGKNLNQLVRDHADWFELDDLKEYGATGPRGAVCLRNLGRARTDHAGIRRFWKGWTWA